LVDTAGLRMTEDRVEQLGIERSLNELAAADLMLWVVDSSAPDFNLEADLESLQAPRLILLNKADLHAEEITLPQQWIGVEKMSISAHRPEDIDRLKDKIFEYITGQMGAVTEDSMLTNLRQEESAIQALSALNGALRALDCGAGEELLSLDLSLSLKALGEIVGETTPDDMLNQIFSNFCIGK